MYDFKVTATISYFFSLLLYFIIIISTIKNIIINITSGLETPEVNVIIIILITNLIIIIVAHFSVIIC